MDHLSSHGWLSEMVGSDRYRQCHLATLYRQHGTGRYVPPPSRCEWRVHLKLEVWFQLMFRMSFRGWEQVLCFIFDHGKTELKTTMWGICF